MAKKFLGAFLLLLVPLFAAGQDKSKKAYELIYDDVQVLKEQVRTLQTRLDGAAEDIRALREQVKVLADLVRQSIADQAGARDSLNTIPAQYQDML
ncbi:MAG TPA: tol-pal system protein YbgF, partial [Acidobacteriota bacterium]|nr:tol-pal system protein YbgF [Acidobacteriota bacterium]